MGANFAYLTDDFHVSLFCYKKGLHAVSDTDKADAGRVKRKSAFKHATNAQVQIILRMRKVSSGPLHLYTSSL